jgi:osmotically inducible lipoprotein OsmB
MVTPPVSGACFAVRNVEYQPTGANMRNAVCLLAVASSLVLCGCSSTGTGAVLGGAAGAATVGGAKGAIGGAAVGGIIGHEVGERREERRAEERYERRLQEDDNRYRYRDRRY